jgi:hypothetical protein
MEETTFPSVEVLASRPETRTACSRPRAVSCPGPVRSGPVVRSLLTVTARTRVRRYGRVMSKWPKGWVPETKKDAQRYLKAHENGAGDPDLLETCERMVERPAAPSPNPSRGH